MIRVLKTIRNQIGPAILSALIWLQAVCIDYQQTSYDTITHTPKSSQLTTTLDKQKQSLMRVINSLDPAQPQHTSGLICIQNVCKDYQHTSYDNINHMSMSSQLGTLVRIH